MAGGVVLCGLAEVLRGGLRKKGDILTLLLGLALVPQWWRRLAG